MASRWLLVITALTTIQSAPGTPYEEQRFAIEPQDRMVVVGSRVRLPCRVINKSGILQWIKDDLVLGHHRELPDHDRYRMIGSYRDGDYSLEIYPVKLEDDATYYCEVKEGPHGEPAIVSRAATLTVLVPSGPPKITQGEFLVAAEGREIELECISKGGKPPAQIRWMDSLGNEIMDNVDYTVEPLSDGLRYTTKSVLKLVPRKQDHDNTTFTCRARRQDPRVDRHRRLQEALRCPVECYYAAAT